MQKALLFFDFLKWHNACKQTSRDIHEYKHNSLNEHRTNLETWRWTVKAKENTKTFNEPCDLSSNEVKQDPSKLEVKHSKNRIPTFNNH